MRLKVSNVCQLLDKSKFPATHTQLGCTFTNNGDGSFTINGTVQNGGSWSNPLQQITQNLYGHKILLLTNSTSDIVRGEMKFTLQNDSSRWGTYNSIYTVEYDDYKYIAIRIYMDDVDAGKTIDNATVKFQFFDLTEMYGAGHEPTTVAQFRQDFPNEMYEYSPVCWKKFRRLKYVTETKNLLKLNDFSNSWLTIKNNTIRIKKTSDLQSFSDAIFSPLQTDLKSDKYYRISAKVIGEFTGRLYKFFGNSLWGNAINNNRWQSDFTLASVEDKYGLTINQNSGTTVGCTLISDEVFIYDIMLEESDAAFVGQAEYVPSGYLPLNRGKYIANKEPVQLLDKSKFKTGVSKGVTATPNITNGMWTISGAATASEYLQIGVYYPGTDFNIGDKLFLRNSNIDNSVYFPYAAWYDKDNKYLGEKDGDGTFSVTNPETAYIACYFTTRTVADINVTTQVQLFNLTRMYGKGNEPTAAEFVAQYPGFDYSVNKYNAITFR